MHPVRERMHQSNSQTGQATTDDMMMMGLTLFLAELTL